MAFLGDWQFNETLTLYLQTVNPDTGAAWPADTFPTYRLYAYGSSTPLLTGTYATLDASGVTGLYAAQIALTTAAGFVRGTTYAVRTAVTIVGALEAFEDTFTLAGMPIHIVPARVVWKAGVLRSGVVLTVTPARLWWRTPVVDLTSTGTLIAVGAGGNWTTAATWTPAVTPTAAHNCLLNATSGPVTIDAGAVCRSVNVTGYTSTLTHTAGVTLTIGDDTAGLNGVALEFPTSGWTYTLGSTSSSALNFVSTSAAQQTVNFGGKTVGAVTFNATSGGSWKYTGAHVTASSSATLLLTKGTLDINGQTVTLVGTCVFRSNASANVRSLTLGAAAITTGTWDMGSGVNLTLSAAAATITLRLGTGTFNGGGKTYGTVIVPTGGTTLAIAGANTFTQFSVTAPRTVQFTAATTTTFLNPPSLVGTSGNVITISSVTAATHTLSLASGTVTADWLSLTNSIATGGAVWNAGVHSVDNGGNTGWLFGTLTLTPARVLWQAQSQFPRPPALAAQVVWRVWRVRILQEFPFREITPALFLLPD